MVCMSVYGDQSASFFLCSCNCGPCRKVQGLGPTGLLIRSARASGFSNVHDFLIAQRTRESPQAIWERKRGRGWCRTGELDCSQSSDLIKQTQDAIAAEKAQKCRKRLSFHSPDKNSCLTEILGCKNGHGTDDDDDDDDGDYYDGTKKKQKKKKQKKMKQDQPITVRAEQNIAVNPQLQEKHKKKQRRKKKCITFHQGKMEKRETGCITFQRMKSRKETSLTL